MYIYRVMILVPFFVLCLFVAMNQNMFFEPDADSIFHNECQIESIQLKHYKLRLSKKFCVKISYKSTNHNQICTDDGDMALQVFQEYALQWSRDSKKNCKENKK